MSIDRKHLDAALPDFCENVSEDVLRLLTAEEIDSISGGPGGHMQIPGSKYDQGPNAPDFKQFWGRDYTQGYPNEEAQKVE